MTEVTLLVLGGAFGFAINLLLDLVRNKDTVLSLQRDNKRLESENTTLRQKLADYEKAELDRFAKENNIKNHDRNQQETDILRMLGTHGSKSVKQIAEHIGIGEELVIKHLIDLCDDNCVRSQHYMPGDEEWAIEPCDSVWHIQQAGRAYLARNNLL